MTIAQRVADVTARVNAETERRSWHRAIAAKVMAQRRNEDGSRIVKSAWPNDDRALALTKGGVTQTTSAGCGRTTRSSPTQPRAIKCSTRAVPTRHRAQS